MMLTSVPRRNHEDMPTDAKKKKKKKKKKKTPKHGHTHARSHPSTHAHTHPSTHAHTHPSTQAHMRTHTHTHLVLGEEGDAPAGAVLDVEVVDVVGDVKAHLDQKLLPFRSVERLVVPAACVTDKREHTVWVKRVSCGTNK